MIVGIYDAVWGFNDLFNRFETLSINDITIQFPTLLCALLCGYLGMFLMIERLIRKKPESNNTTLDSEKGL